MIAAEAERTPPREYRVVVVGAGSWGTALAVHAARAGHHVRLWGRDERQIRTMDQARVNAKYLPGVDLPARLLPVVDGALALEQAEIAISAVPSRHTRAVWEQFSDHLPAGCHLISATKGIEQGSGWRMTEVLAQCAPQAGSYAALSGPSFAQELADRHPTAIALGCTSADAADELQRALSYGPLRVYRNDDVVGVELGGALKNVIAIASGISDGLGFGSNSQAALVCRGLKEMTQLACRMGAQGNTLMGLSGLGDLVLTCTGPLSRNRSLGVRIGKGESLEAIEATAHSLAEGTVTVRSAMQLSALHDVEMPITEQVHGVLYDGATPQAAIERLLARELVGE